MAKIVTMGEIMLRLSTPGSERFIQADSFDVNYGGGEANVAVSLANYGDSAYFVTKLPSNEIGDAALNSLRRYGVHTDYIKRGGERLGIYYLESGVSMRASKVIYDRSHSAISEAKDTDFVFDQIFEGASWFHFSGITPALSDSARDLTLQALKAAKRHNVTVSCDLNYRKKLWTVEKAREVMTSLMPFVDVCIGNEEDADNCLGFKPEGTNVTEGTLNISGYESIFRQMKAKFGFKYIVSSLRESYSASDNGWSGIAYDGNEFYHSKKYEVRIVDRVGAGDSFAAGFIHRIVSGNDMKDALEFAVAASALKHTIPGDFNMVSEKEVLTLAQGDASGRVQR